MDFNAGMEQLTKFCQGKDWFHDIGTDAYGRYVIYVNYMNKENLCDLPGMMAGKQVMIHFVASHAVSKNQFVNKVNEFSVSPLVDEMTDVVTETVGSNPEESSLRFLQNELDKLEKICGSYTLQDIFYEVQDGKNAVTNMSARYPEVRERLEKLYNQYGFDVIYEELDG